MPTFLQPTKRDPHPGSFAASALHALQRKIGNQAAQQIFQPKIQTQLRVSEPGDSDEREADRVSDQVMRMSEPVLQRACSCGGSCPSCKSAPDESLQLSRTQAAGPAAAPSQSLVHDALNSPGRPLDSSTRAFMEPRFGYDFSRVRVHSGALAEQSARDLNAHAYTIGHDIVFAAGQFSPGTEDGRRLLAHELTHVVQQGGASSVIQRQPAGSDPEREAAIAEAEATLRVTTEQLEEQADAEVRLKLDDRRKHDQRYGRLLALKDRARILKKHRISLEHQQEMGVKLRFLEKEAKAAYLTTLRDVLSEYPEETLQILAGPPAPATTLQSSEEHAQQLGCDPGQHQYALEYQDAPERARCMDIRTDPEFRDNLADRNIASVVGYAVEGTTWENVEYDSFKAMVVKYKNGTVDYFMLDEVGNFQYGSNARIIRDFTYLKRKTGYLYPVHAGQIYTNEVLTPNLLAYKNGLKYQVKDLQALYQLLAVAGTFAAITSIYGVAEGFRQSVKPFGHGKGGRRRIPRAPRRTVPASEPENTSTGSKQVAENAGWENAAVSRVFEHVGGNKLGYTVRICNNSTVIETPTTRQNVGLMARDLGGAFPDHATQTVWIHESVVADGGIHRRWGRLTLPQVVAHELGHVRGGGFDCAKSSRLGAEQPGLTATERQGLLDDAANIEGYLAPPTKK